MLAPKRGWPSDDVGLGRGEDMNSAMKQDVQPNASGELHQILKLPVHSDGLFTLRQPSQENEGEIRGWVYRLPAFTAVNGQAMGSRFPSGKRFQE